MTTSHRGVSLTGLFLGVSAALALAVGLAGSVPVARAATPIVLSAKITSGTNVAISFSEPVATSLGSYSNFTGALSGHSLIGIAGGGTNTVTLTFSGSSFPAGSNGGLTISGATVSVSDGSPYAGGAVSVVDSRPPSLVAFSVSSNDGQTALGTSGNYLTISFTLSASVTNEHLTLAGHTLYPSGSGAGPYTIGYSLTAQDASYSAIPIVVTYTDQYGNSGTMNFTFNNAVTSGATSASGGSLPVISSITSNARTVGWLKIGDSITFTLIPLAAEPNAHVQGSYNGVPLVWSTSNGGVTYTATYTVATGNADQNIPVQIGGVTLTDQYGNVSAPASGNDVGMMISANGPYIYESIPVPSATGSTNPTYQFVSNKDGTITYGGDCISPTTEAQRGNNTITFINLKPGTHSTCTITVTDAAGNVGNILRVSTFTVLGSATGSTTTGTVTPLVTTPAATPTTTAVTTPTATYAFTLFLGIGSTGTQVRDLQNYLAAKGFYSGPVTAYFGSLTQAAVKKYQAAHGISAVGYVGPGTRAALNAGE